MSSCSYSSHSQRCRRSDLPWILSAKIDNLWSMWNTSWSCEANLEESCSETTLLEFSSQCFKSCNRTQCDESILESRRLMSSLSVSRSWFFDDWFRNRRRDRQKFNKVHRFNNRQQRCLALRRICNRFKQLRHNLEIHDVNDAELLESKLQEADARSRLFLSSQNK